jgi:hypothetical protein
MMFCLQAIDFFAQRGILYFIHPAPRFCYQTFTYIAATAQTASGKRTESNSGCGILS